jgi:hypothetical protein
MDVVKAAQLSGRTLERVVVHPLVLLSIVDHYNRVARDTRKRVVGVLLGTSSRGTVDVTNSYAGKPSPPNPLPLGFAPPAGLRGGSAPLTDLGFRGIGPGCRGSSICRNHQCTQGL